MEHDNGIPKIKRQLVYGAEYDIKPLFTFFRIGVRIGFILFWLSIWIMIKGW